MNNLHFHQEFAYIMALAIFHLNLNQFLQEKMTLVSYFNFQLRKIANFLLFISNQ